MFAVCRGVVRYSWWAPKDFVKAWQDSEVEPLLVRFFVLEEATRVRLFLGHRGSLDSCDKYVRKKSAQS